MTTLTTAPVFVIRRARCAAYFSVALALPADYEQRELVGLGRGEAVCGCQACAGLRIAGYWRAVARGWDEA